MGIWPLVALAAIVGVVLGAVQILRTDAGIAAHAKRTARRPATWLVGVPAMALILAVGMPFVETRLLNGPTPKPLTFADLAPVPAAGPRPSSGPGAATPGVTVSTTTASTTTVLQAAAAAASQVSPAGELGAPKVSVLAGGWSVGSGSEARYGIDDTAMGQTSRVVGRTKDMSGAMRIAGPDVTSVRVVVNMQTVSCQCVHDAKYHQMLETSKYPTSMFELTKAIPVGPVPPPGTVVRVPVTGNFTIHGVTRSVSFTLDATRIGARVAVKGAIPVKLSDYNIQSPNAGSMGGLSNCDIELLIAFDRTTA